VRVGGLSLPTEAVTVDNWPTEGLRPGSVYLSTGDSSQTDLPAESVDLVVTDPPYMDNVHYSELADFFHAWLREPRPYARYPNAAITTRSTREVQSSSPAEFEAAIGRVWQECARVLKPSGLLAFTFHQARLSGWVALMRALAQADLVVTAVQPVKGEMATSVTKGGLEPSNLDAVIVCRKHRDSAPGWLLDPIRAAHAGEHLLAELRSAGVDVGAGDIRSVIRGHVLATYTAKPEATDIDALASLADELADERATRLAGDK
jgi:putative DNA methylase